MQISHDRESLIELATKYYKEGLSQQALAKLYGVSRPTIASLLKRCHDEKIVEIRIASPAAAPQIELAETLQSKFGLKHVELISTSNTLSEVVAIGKQGGEYLNSLLKDGMNVGLSWGSSVYTVIQNIPNRRLNDANAVQTMGGFGGIHHAEDGYSVLSDFARRTNAAAKMLLAPMLVQSGATRDMFLKENSIRDVLDMMSELDLILVGIGSVQPSHSTLVTSGFIDKKEAKKIQQQGGVGLICGHHYDIDGKLLDLPINYRLIGIQPEQIKSTKDVVGVAWGTDKVLPICGALKTGLITSLITSEETAVQILNTL